MKIDNPSRDRRGPFYRMNVKGVFPSETFVFQVEEPRVLSKAELERKEAEHRKKQVAMAKVRVNLNILKTDLQDAIQNQDFIRSGHLQKKTLFSFESNHQNIYKL